VNSPNHPDSPGSPNSPVDAGEPALPDTKRRPLQGKKALHAARRRENDTGVPASQRTTAWPLALIAICLIVYASLYPFTEWRDQGISPFHFLSAPLPQYWSGFDVAANVVGYVPVGFLLALSALRSRRLSHAVTGAVFGAVLLSLGMETLQSYLPSRVPSNVDLVLNTMGAWLGACCAWTLEAAGFVDQWSRIRARWFATEARGALVLLALWPVALLFPAAVPLGLGQVFERLEAALADALANSPFLEWMPMRDVELQPLVPLTEVVCVALSVLVPCLLAYGVVRTLWQRLVFSVAIFLAGIAASALSAALSYGPEHAWAWLELPVQVGLVLGGFLALMLLALPRRGAAALALLALAINLGLLNQAPVNPYFAQTLQTWEQGRFIRFHGVVQWLGWLWPYAAMVYVLVRLSGRDRASAS